MNHPPKTMRAVALSGHGGLDKLEFHADWPAPVCGEGEVLIRISACGLNNTDVNTRTGWYSKSVTNATGGGEGEAGDAAWGGAPIKFPRIQGADVVGVVAAVGGGVDKNLGGRRVMVDAWLRDWNDPQNLNKTGYLGSERDGGYAEWLSVDARNVHTVDSTLSDAELATFATSSVTAENMLNRAAVTTGDAVLIPGASGGVGSALIQLANRRGARAIAMCGADKAEAVRAIGAAAVLPRAPGDLQAALSGAGFATVTVVADVVGGKLFPQLLSALSRGGRYTCAGAIAGPMVELDLRTCYLHDLTLSGATVPPPGAFADLVRYIERGEIKPLLAAAYPLEKLRDAQQAFMEKGHVGNIVVTMK